jgi:putative hydrolase of the HAD superfamily
VIRAVLLDVLGTLCYLDEPGPRLRRELAARGIDVPEDAAGRASRAEIAYYLEHQMEGATAAGLEDLRDRCAGVIRDSLGLPAERQADVRAAMLDSLVFVPFPDAVPALRALRERGLRLVAASNWDVSLEDALARMGLAPLLDGAVSSVVAGAAKPDPRVFWAALEVAGCAAGEALFAGDSVENDVEGARVAGLRAVLVARGGEAPPGVEAVSSLEELPSLISRG